MPLHEVDPLEQDERAAEAAKVRDHIAKKKAFADGLREIADLIEQHPDLDVNPMTGYVFIGHDLEARSPDELVTEFKASAAMLGTYETSTSAGYFNAIRRFGPHKVEVTLAASKLAWEPPPHPLEQNSVKAPDDV